VAALSRSDRSPLGFIGNARSNIRERKLVGSVSFTFVLLSCLRVGTLISTEMRTDWFRRDTCLTTPSKAKKTYLVIKGEGRQPSVQEPSPSFANSLLQTFDFDKPLYGNVSARIKK